MLDSSRCVSRRVVKGHKWVSSVPSGHNPRVSADGSSDAPSAAAAAPHSCHPPPPLPHHLRTHPPRLFLALSRQQHTAKETDSARMTAPLSSEAATAKRDPVPAGCGAAAGKARAGERGRGEGPTLTPGRRPPCS